MAIVSLKRLVLLAVCALLTACQAVFQTPSPTRDPDKLYTQVANTMVAGMLATRQAQPSPTPQPTATASRTPRVVEATASATSSTDIQPATAAPATPGTPTAAGSAPGDKAEFVYHTPGKGFRIQKNRTWTLTLNIKNTGTETWTTGYFLAYASGERMGSPEDFFLTKEIKPGETYTFVFTMQAPNETGKKQVTLAFRDDKGRDLLYIDLDVNVTE